MEDIKMFSYGLNNMNMYGINTMSFGNMGMFNMGGINMFGNMFGSSIFTNCDGSYNYDAMAGFGVGQVLMNIGGLMLGKVCANAQANSKKTLSANVDNLDTQIYDIETEKQGYVNEKTELETANETAESNVQSYTSELENLKNAETKAENDMKAAHTAWLNAPEEKKTALQTAYYEAVDAYNKAKTEREAKAKEIAEQEAIIKENKAKIEALAEKIKACEEELEALKAERDAIQAQLNEAVLDKADGVKLTRTTTEEFAKLYDIENNDYKAGFDASNVSKSDLRYIISQYRTSENAETKEKWAKVMKKIYNDTNLDSSVKSDNIRAAYKLMCE